MIIMIFLITLIFFFILIQGYCLYVIKRSSRTREFLLDLLEQINMLVKRDLIENKDGDWRFQEFKKVSFCKIALSFKRLKPENYWQNLSFLK